MAADPLLTSLYELACRTVRPQRLGSSGTCGDVACAVESTTGQRYTGICIDVVCSMGFCAEHAALAEMLKHGETAIRAIVAVNRDGAVMPPCGRCREFMVQLDPKNLEARVMVAEDRTMTLDELLPCRFDES